MMRYDAREFLRSLFEADRPEGSAPRASTPAAAPAPASASRAPRHEGGIDDRLANLTPADLPSDWRVEWEERAAVREYDGGQAREHAEAEALTEILARMRRAVESTARKRSHDHREETIP